MDIGDGEIKYMSVASIISLLGGLAFFLFGMSLMVDSLKKVAGGKLEMRLGQLTSSPARGVLLGTFVTAVIQSSSATSVMVVGFVNSGMMTLVQGIPIIMGANIGTTATGWILSISSIGGSAADLLSASTIFSIISITGVLFFMLSNTLAKKNTGIILLALGVLLNGMQLMSSAMIPLRINASFLNAMSVASNPFLCITIGILVTAVVQSCSASIGILQALAVTGVIENRAAIYLVVGMSIGACVPVLLSSIGANMNGRRTAFSYLYFDAIGGAVFMILFTIITSMINIEPYLSSAASSTGIAIINTAFKVFAVLALFPARNLLAKLAIKTFPDKTGEEEEQYETSLLDERFLAHPAIAIEQCFTTVHQMADASKRNFYASTELIFEYDQNKFDRLQRREKQVDNFEDALGDYLVRLSKNQLSDIETKRSGLILQSLSNFERISDHAVDISELAHELHEKKASFSDDAKAGLKICIEAVAEIVELANDAFKNLDVNVAKKVEPLEETVDIITERIKGRHIQRLQEGRCTLSLGFILNGCADNLERIADHCSNIALLVIESHMDTALMPHTYTATIKSKNDTTYEGYFAGYEQRYLQRLELAEKLEDERLLNGRQTTMFDTEDLGVSS